MKNDDETFFQQFHKAPRQEFADALYQRINKPMNAQKTNTNLRRTQKLALTFAAAAALLLAAWLLVRRAETHARRTGSWTLF